MKPVETVFKWLLMDSTPVDDEFLDKVTTLVGDFIHNVSDNEIDLIYQVAAGEGRTNFNTRITAIGCLGMLSMVNSGYATIRLQEVCQLYDTRDKEAQTAMAWLTLLGKTG